MLAAAPVTVRLPAVLPPAVAPPEAGADPPESQRATPLSLLQSCLGLSFDCPRSRVRLDSPLLPSFLDDVCLTRLSLHDAHVDVTLHRRAEDLSVEVSGRQGTIGVDLS